MNRSGPVNIEIPLNGGQIHFKRTPKGKLLMLAEYTVMEDTVIKAPLTADPILRVLEEVST